MHPEARIEGRILRSMFSWRAGMRGAGIRRMDGLQVLEWAWVPERKTSAPLSGLGWVSWGRRRAGQASENFYQGHEEASKAWLLGRWLLLQTGKKNSLEQEWIFCSFSLRLWWHLRRNKFNCMDIALTGGNCEGSRLANFNTLECERGLEWPCVCTRSLVWKHKWSAIPTCVLTSVFPLMVSAGEPGTELALASIVSPRLCVLPGTY